MDNTTTTVETTTTRANCDLFNFVTWGVIGGVLCVFGFFGNILSLVAFARDKRAPTSTLLQCLAASDFILLLSVFITDALPYICDFTGSCENPWRSWPYIRFLWISTPISHMCSIWFVILVALNRFWAVCRPHTTLQVWNNYKTPFYVCFVLLVVISFNLPRFFEYKVVEVQVTNTTSRLKEERTDFGNTFSYSVVYKVMLVNIVLILIPLILIFVLTVFIVLALQTRARQGAPGRRSRTSEITFVLVAVVVTAIVCQTPLCVFHFVRYSTDYWCGEPVFYLDNISKLLVNINACINFMIYCLSSPKFRQLLFLALTCRTGQQVEPFGMSRMETTRRGSERTHVTRAGSITTQNGRQSPFKNGRLSSTPMCNSQSGTPRGSVKSKDGNNYETDV